jgi:hypothetical protein
MMIWVWELPKAPFVMDTEEVATCIPSAATRPVRAVNHSRAANYSRHPTPSLAQPEVSLAMLYLPQQRKSVRQSSLLVLYQPCSFSEPRLTLLFRVHQLAERVALATTTLGRCTSHPPIHV